VRLLLRLRGILLQQRQQQLHALVGGPLNLDGGAANRLDHFAHKLNVDVHGVLFELEQHGIDIGVVDQKHKDVLSVKMIQRNKPQYKI
jgi:hypothetical protein